MGADTHSLEEEAVPSARLIVKGLGGEVLPNAGSSEDMVLALIPRDAGCRLPGALAYLASTLPQGLAISTANRAVRTSGFVVVREAHLRDILERRDVDMFSVDEALEELTGERGDAFRLVFHPRVKEYFDEAGIAEEGGGNAWAVGDVVVVESLTDALTAAKGLRWRVARRHEDLAWTVADVEGIAATLDVREWVATIVIPRGEDLGALPPMGRLDVRGTRRDGLRTAHKTHPLLWDSPFSEDAP